MFYIILYIFKVSIQINLQTRENSIILTFSLQNIFPVHLGPIKHFNGQGDLTLCI